MACSHIVADQRAAKAKLDGLKLTKQAKTNQRDADRETKTECDKLIPLLEDFMKFVGDYSGALEYIGFCLTYVIINDLPFDKGMCKELASAMKGARKQLEDILNDMKDWQKELETSIKQLTSEINKLALDIKSAQAAYETQMARTGLCSACAAAAAAAAADLSGASSSGSGRVSSCFPAGTKVFASTGLINIENIKDKDEVWSYNEETGEKELNKVIKLLIHENSKEDMYELLINGEMLKVTEAHRFYIVTDEAYDWIKVKDLKIGDKVLFINNDTYPIEDIKHHSNKETVYNLEVENNHNYYVSNNGVLVHNRKTR